jgi:hypothetical protein
MFAFISKFEYANNKIAFAELVNSNKSTFINKEGEPSIKEFSKVEISNLAPDECAVYFNQLLGENKFNNVYTFRYADGNIALAINSDNKITFTNIKGEISIKGMDYDDLNNLDEIGLAAYYNILKNTNIFVEINEFKYAFYTIAFARLKNDKTAFINRDGNLSIEKISENDLEKMTDEELETYISQKENKLKL